MSYKLPASRGVIAARPGADKKTAALAAKGEETVARSKGLYIEGLLHLQTLEQ
jgi:hypothetical protein